MRNLIHALAVAAGTALAAMPTAAVQARDVQIDMGDDGPSITFGDDNRDYRRDDRRDRWDDRREDRGRAFRECLPERALAKAQRMGIRRPRIDHVGRRSIAVSGWQRGDRVMVRFDRWDRRCAILD